MTKTAISKIMLLAVVALLALGSAIAVNVTTRPSGIVASSIRHSFVYDPAAEKVVVDSVQPTDLIAITAGSRKREFFFTKLIDKIWKYDDTSGARGLLIAMGERVPVDVDGDKAADLEMEYTAQYGRKSLFTFYKPGTAPQAEAEIVQLAAPVETAPEEPEALAATVEAEPAPENVTEADIAPEELDGSPDLSVMTGSSISSSQKQGTNLFIAAGIGIAIVAAIAGVFFISRRKGGGKSEGERPVGKEMPQIIE